MSAARNKQRKKYKKLAVIDIPTNQAADSSELQPSPPTDGHSPSVSMVFETDADELEDAIFAEEEEFVSREILPSVPPSPGDFLFAPELGHGSSPTLAPDMLELDAEPPVLEVGPDDDPPIMLWSDSSSSTQLLEQDIDTISSFHAAIVVSDSPEHDGEAVPTLEAPFDEITGPIPVPTLEASPEEIADFAIRSGGRAEEPTSPEEAFQGEVQITDTVSDASDHLSPNPWDDEPNPTSIDASSEPLLDEFAADEDVPVIHLSSRKAYLELMEAALERGDSDGLVAVFEEAVLHFPDAGEFYACLGAALLTWFFAADARAVLLKGLEVIPDDPQLLEALVEAEIQLNEPDHARALIAALWMQKPSILQANRLLRQMLRLGDLDASLERVQALKRQSNQWEQGLEVLEREISFRSDSLQHAARIHVGKVVAELVRAPAKVIGGYVDLLLRENDPARRREFLRGIQLQLELLSSGADKIEREAQESDAPMRPAEV